MFVGFGMIVEADGSFGALVVLLAGTLSAVVAELLVEEEVNRRLAESLTDVRSFGAGGSTLGVGIHQSS